MPPALPVVMTSEGAETTTDGAFDSENVPPRWKGH